MVAVRGKSLASLIGLLLFSNIVSAPPYPGYIFYASGAKGYLINPTGETVHIWNATSSAQSHADLLPDGSVLFPMQPNSPASTLLTNPTSCPLKGMSGGFPHGRLQQINWNNQVVWDAIVCDATFTPAYDAEPIAKPDGSYTVLIGGISSSNGVKLVEIKPVPPTGKEILWQYDLPADGIANGFVNSISYNPDLGEGGYIAINYNMGRKIVVIDKAKKSVIFSYTVSTGTGNHAVMWVSRYFLGTTILQPDADAAAMRVGNLVVVNNSIKAIELKFNTENKTLTWVKDFTNAFASHEGSVQRLPNGNTLVQNGMQSNGITEFDDNGQKVRTVVTQGSAQRSYMYGPSYPGLKNYTNLKRNAGMEPFGAGAATYTAAVRAGKITVVNTNGSLMRCRIYSLSGKIVFSASTRGNEFVFSTGALTAGVYYIDVRNGSGVFLKSFVTK